MKNDLEYEDSLSEFQHHGIKGQEWGVRNGPPYPLDVSDRSPKEVKESSMKNRFSSKSDFQTKIKRIAYDVGFRLRPVELEYSLKKMLNNPTASKIEISKNVEKYAEESGILPIDKKALEAVEAIGIVRHQNAVYNNISDGDIEKLKDYTNSSRFSRRVNSYLATGEPKNYAGQANAIKDVLRKNKIENVTVYRSCNIKFSTNGISKKLEDYSDMELKKSFESMSNRYAGKKLNENRIFSTSTSPLFAIDTWRSLNPTAAKTYNTYMIINCKGTAGIYADGITTSGKKLVNSRSNQEVILAPTQLQYKKLSYDTERDMYVITVDAI